MEYQQNAIAIRNHSEKTDRNNLMLTVTKSIVLLFLFFWGIHSALAKDTPNKTVLEHEKNTIGSGHNKALREFLAPFKYQVDNQVYEMTEYDIEMLNTHDFIRMKSQQEKDPNIIFEKPDFFKNEEIKLKGEGVNLYRTKLDVRDRKKTSLVPKKVLKNTNRLDFFLERHRNNKGEMEWLTMDISCCGRAYSLTQDGEYRKQIKIIENYKHFIDILASLKMEEVKENLSISQVDVSVGIIFKKDTSKIYELYFHDFKNDANSGLLIIDLKNRKFYHLERDDILIDLFNQVFSREE